MSNPNPRTDHIEDTQWKPGQSGNPAGKPKGSIHISTHIRNLLEDEKFSPKIIDGKAFKGTPLKAIILTAMKKSHAGDTRWADWLAKYGYGQKLEVDHTTQGESIKSDVPSELIEEFTAFLKNKTQQ